MKLFQFNIAVGSSIFKQGKGVAKNFIVSRGDPIHTESNSFGCILRWECVGFVFIATGTLSSVRAVVLGPMPLFCIYDTGFLILEFASCSGFRFVFYSVCLPRLVLAVLRTTYQSKHVCQDGDQF